jgi:hypothetical protein
MAFQISVEWSDSREHCYQFDVKAVPRVGETIEINGNRLRVTEVIHDLDGWNHITLKTRRLTKLDKIWTGN